MTEQSTTTKLVPDIYAVNPVFDDVDSSSIIEHTSMVEMVKDVMEILSRAETEDYWGVAIHFNPGRPDALFYDWEIPEKKKPWYSSIWKFLSRIFTRAK